MATALKDQISVVEDVISTWRGDRDAEAALVDVRATLQLFARFEAPLKAKLKALLEAERNPLVKEIEDQLGAKMVDVHMAEGE